ncbi:hypothetical protein [Streptosporangium sp. KLBMP 9127]|nr:hypothetical protein [Streptosporangium sp. KLBMP 9127]
MRELALLGQRTRAVDPPGHGLDAQQPAARPLRTWRRSPPKPTVLASVTLDDDLRQ